MGDPAFSFLYLCSAHASRLGQLRLEHALTLLQGFYLPFRRAMTAKKAAQSD